MELLVMVTLAIAVLCMSLYYVLRKSSTKANFRLPPGPQGSVVFGHLFKNWFDPEYYGEIAKEYGEIFTLKIMWKNIIVVNSYEAIKEAFSHDWLAGRMTSPVAQVTARSTNGLVLSEGLLWRTHRRFTLSVLRDFGLGRSRIELTIQDELQHLRDTINSQKGQAFAPHHAYAKAVSNVINSIVFNERCSEDPEFESIVEFVKIISSPSRSAAFAILRPIMKHLPGDVSGIKRHEAIKKDLFDYLDKKFRQHKETFNPANIRDYIDAFLLESEGKDESLSFTEKQLRMALLDLFIAGMETTSTTLLWATIYLARNRHVQRRIFEEIDQTIGLSKLPETADKLNMRYTDAVIHEVQRFSSLVPLGVPHRATETGQLRGYDIPKDTVVIADLWGVHRSEKLWKDPHNFNPENFLDADGNLINTNYMLAFSTGKRVCLGETLARQELFIFVTGLMQQFEFVEDPAHPLPGYNDCERSVFLRGPKPFRVIARRRSVE